MSPIQEIFKAYGPEYLHRYGDRMPTEHKKVMRALQNCRSGEYGTAVYRCDQCGSRHALPCSCGNRHCPSCQHGKAEVWLHTQLRRLLPCHYFLITITLPKALQCFIRTHQRSGYAALFSCTYAALKMLAADSRFLGSSSIGFLAVLHTWGSQLQYHPHLHLIVPGGGLAPDKSSWLSSRHDLFVHSKPLARIIRAKFRDAMNSAGLLAHIDPSVWSQDWVIDTQAVGSGDTSLRYLARYVFRVAISNNRIISYQNHSVTFRYKVSHSRRWRTMTLDAIEFIRRFLQHVLPAGFMKVRHYGFLNGNAALPLEMLRDLVCAFYRLLRDTLPIPVSFTPATPRCPFCQGSLRFFWFFPPLRKEAPSG